MDLKDLLIVFIVVGLVCTSFVFILGGFGNVYGQTANISRFNTTFNKVNDMTGFVNDFSNTSMGTGGIDESSGFTFFSKKIWQAMKSITQVPAFFNAILNDSLGYYNLGWVVPYLYLILIVVVIFSLIYFFWGQRT